MGPGPIWRRMSTRRLTLAAAVLAIVGCGGGSTPAPSGVTDEGFPLGSFVKELDDPEVGGRIRIVWTFTGDGRFTEVPLALDGQRLDALPVRGTFTAAADAVTIATNYPPGMGTSTHGWRLDGDRLWTFLLESSNPDDAEWFEDLDSRPWEPYRS